MEKLRFLFIEFTPNFRNSEYNFRNAHLAGYIFELFKERILAINKNFRDWRNITNNKLNSHLNVSQFI